MLEYGILGTLLVRRDGAELLLTAPKPRTMLLALLLHPNAMVTADHLVDDLWPEAPPKSAKKLVQVYVSQLRSALGVEEIVTVASGYRLRVAPDGLDADRFGRLRVSARQALAEGNHDLAAALAKRGLALWRGPALADVAAMPFASAEAALLDELRLECVEDRLDAELALGRHEDALGELQHLCTEHPLRERARERLALALYRCGRQTEALDVLADGRRILLEELGLDPGQSHQDLELAILGHDPGLDVRTAPVPAAPLVPTPPSSLVGRIHEVEQLTDLLTREDVRIVTISGAGGSGKTRVALEVARTAGTGFANGAAFVELGSIRDPSLVPGAIARALGVPETPEEAPPEALARWLAGRDVLLVVDNFEHVIDAAPELARMVQQAPRLTVLVTSRRVLHVSGEHVFPLTPLPMDDAVRLFSERVAERDPSVSMDGDTAEVIRTICRRLDCLPLALELAAARSSTLSPSLLLERLSDWVTSLGVGPRDAPARQQTLTDTLRWSTDLLDDSERLALARLSVFTGGCTIEAAEATGGADLDRLTALVDSSLLQRLLRPGGVRLTMLETVRQHAAELLQQLGGHTDAVVRHTAYYVALAEGTELKGPGQAGALRIVDHDLDNLRAACERAELAGDDEAALRIATSLYRYWYLRGLFREGRDRIAGPLGLGAGDPPLQALALRAIAGLQFMLGDLDEAEALADRGIEVATAAGALEPVMACHTVLSHIARERDEFEVAQGHLEQSESIAEQLGLHEDVMVANTNLGELALAVGDLDQARLRWERTLAFYGGHDEENTTFALLGLGSVAYRQGRLDEAAEHFTQARDLAEGAGFLHNTMMALVGLAGVVADQGATADAALLLGRAAGLLTATGGKLTVADEAIYQRARAAALADLGEVRLAELLETGAGGLR